MIVMNWLTNNEGQQYNAFVKQCRPNCWWIEQAVKEANNEGQQYKVFYDKQQVNIGA